MGGWYPDAAKLEIPAGSNDPVIVPRVAILHVDAGNAKSLHRLFMDNQSNGSGVESHFHVRTDGTVEQYRSIYRQADANYHANRFAVSIETQGLGDGEWTAEQLKAIKLLLGWLNRECGIPLVKCPEWDGTGVGYHIQFGSPGAWTNVAKACPGPKRIAQFENVLVPWMRAKSRPVKKRVPSYPNIDAAIKATLAVTGNDPLKFEALRALRALKAKRLKAVRDAA